MAVIFDKDGNELCCTKEGFTGEILIYKGENNIGGIPFDFTNIFPMMTESAVKEFTSQYDEANLSSDAQVSIWNSVLQHFDGIYIYDEKFEMSRIAGEGVQFDYDHATDEKMLWNTRDMRKDGSVIYPPGIYGTGNFSNYYSATVENLALSLIVHEWYSHGMKHNSDFFKSHRLAYKNIINCKELWNNATDDYKAFVMSSLMYYIESDTGRTQMDLLYKKLYEKYGK